MNEIAGVACDAAVELDHLRLRRPNLEFTSVAKVRTWIQPLCTEEGAGSGNVEESLTLWEAYCAILYPFLDPHVDLKTTADLARTATRTVQCLENLLADPERFAREHAPALRVLGDFLVELSRAASAREHRSPIPRLSA